MGPGPQGKMEKLSKNCQNQFSGTLKFNQKLTKSREVENEERSCSILPRKQCRVLTYLLTFPFSSQAAVTVMIVICIPGVFSYTRRGKEQFLFSKNYGYVFRSTGSLPDGSKNITIIL